MYEVVAINIKKTYDVKCVETQTYISQAFLQCPRCEHITLRKKIFPSKFEFPSPICSHYNLSLPPENIRKPYGGNIARVLMTSSLLKDTQASESQPS